jgi:hypothetical protein
VERPAAELAQDYVVHDSKTRLQTAAMCEKQGILATLVILMVPEALRGMPLSLLTICYRKQKRHMNMNMFMFMSRRCLSTPQRF